MKTTTKRRLQKALKISAVALAGSVLFVLLAGVGASFIKGRRKNRAFITCSAEEASATTEETRTIYPSENLLRNKKMGNSTIKGVDITPNADGSFTFMGTAAEEIIYAPIDVASSIRLTAGTYFLSGGISAGIWIQGKLVENDSFLIVDIGNGVVLNLDKDYNFRYNIRIKAGETINTTIYPMLNIGDKAYPFIPNLDGVRQDGYNNGYDIGRQDGNEKGYENGYEDGYGAGVEDSVFFGVSVTAALQKLDGSYEKAYTASPRKSSETFEFGFLTDYFKRNFTEGNYMACSLSLTFEKPVPYYTYLFEMHDLLGALAQLCTVVAEDGTEYTKFRFSRQEGKTGQLEYWGDNIETLKTLKIKQIKDIYLSFPLFDFSPFQYLSMTYKDVAYENGYAIGKQEGEDNAVFTFDNLKSGFFSILDAPFKAIKDALNFEFLGINISNLVLFLLTVIVVVIIIKKAVGK